MVSYWAVVCGNSSSDWAYWDTNRTWSTTSPDLTMCFQKTVLQWLPCGFLWIVSLYYLPVLFKRSAYKVDFKSKLNILKIVFSLLLLLLAVIDFIKAIIDSSSDSKSVPAVLFLNPVIEIVSMSLVVLIIRLEFIKGIPSSGILFFFWLFQLVCRLFIFISQSIRISNGVQDDLLATTAILSWLLTLFQFLAHCFSDKDACKAAMPGFLSEERMPLLSRSRSDVSSRDSGDSSLMKMQKPCPELQASYLSRLTYAWITGLVVRGYRRTLTTTDVWDLVPQQTSAYVVSKTETEWRNELSKSHSSIQKTRSPYAYTHANGIGKGHSQSTADDTYEFMKEVQTIKNDAQKKKYAPSVFATICRVFGPSFAVMGLIKFVTEMLVFVQPQLLKQLINFVEQDSPYEWHGYAYAVGLFLMAMCRSMFFQQYLETGFRIGMQLRCATVGLVYRKALKLSGSSRRDTTVGEIVNLMSVDAQKFQDTPLYLHNIWAAPVIIIVAMIFLWQELGASSLAGVAVMILLIPINAVIASKIKELQFKQMKLKDQRIKLMSEILNGIKVLKLYAWESSFQEKITEIRCQELLVLKKAAYMNALGVVTWFCAPFLVALTTFSVYVLSSTDNVLTSQKAFVSLSLFNIINFPLSIMPAAITVAVQTYVSLTRISKYLMEEELDPKTVERSSNSPDAVRIVDGTFQWDVDAPPALRNVNLTIPDGQLYAVVGTVGSGKSSLINAMLGEMLKSSGRVVVKGRIAYVPQQAWCLNCSLQDNILFGREMQHSKYDQVLEVCALKPDLKVLAAGDRTEIGEKGINLSGGQKQRVSLARAVYQDADVYLLDDPLSAVDSHVGKHLFEQVISREGLLANKTRILVTHGLSHLPKVDCIIVLKDGEISEMGSYSELLSHDGPFAELIRTYLEQEDDSDEEDDEETVVLKEQLRRTISMLSESESESSSVRQRKFSSQRSRSHERKMSSVKERELIERQDKEGEKLITVETAETGSVSLTVFFTYIKALTAAAAIILFASYFSYIACQVSTNLWLSYWSEDTSVANDTAKRDLYLGVYGALGAGQTIFILIESIAWAIGTFNASQRMHFLLLKNVMKTPMSFFDTTPLGRILNRFGKDVDTVDLNIPMTVRDWLATMANVVGTLIVVTIASPIFLAAFLPLAICYYFTQRMYICTARQLKRIDSIKRSPIYSHFQESIVGAPSIRAYRRQNDFIKTSDLLVDDNQAIWYPYIMSNRWVSVFLQTLGNCIILLAAIFAVVSRNNIGAGLAGASVAYSLQVTGAFNYVVRMTCDLETYIVAVERIMEYAELLTEAPFRTAIRPPASWPTRGRIEFQDYSVRYRPGLDLVLKNISAVVNPGEMVGIVGRTGAGKSSLTMGLFRILEPASGNIVIDDIRVTSIGLHDLRGRLTIIPQEPVLFSGTLRMNLDPFDAHSDAEVWTALNQAHLTGFVSGLPNGLQHKCSEGGENLSVGQRQLICLARALLRKTKVLILDEATAAVDLETDDLIQNTIRKEFKGCTILTIAHRLNTIMDYDRIMVLDKGELKEFESPGDLLQMPTSIFYGMCRDAGLV